MIPPAGEKGIPQTCDIDPGDLVITPGEHLGIVVGIYGLGYCEVLLNKGTPNAKIIPFRQIELRRLPQSKDAASL